VLASYVPSGTQKCLVSPTQKEIKMIVPGYA
jgi:hypothetical protein